MITYGTPTPSAGGSSANRTTSFTTIAGNNSVLIVVISLDDSATVNCDTLTFNSVAMLRAIRGAAGGNKRSEIWYYINPPVGTFNVVATYNVSNFNAYGIIQLFGVDQTNPINASNSSAQATSGNPSTSLAITKPNCLLIDVLSKDNDIAPLTPQVQEWDISYSFNRMEGSLKYANPIDTHTMGWNANGGSSSHSVAAIQSADPTSKILINKLRPRIFAPGIAR